MMLSYTRPQPGRGGSVRLSLLALFDSRVLASAGCSSISAGRGSNTCSAVSMLSELQTRRVASVTIVSSLSPSNDCMHSGQNVITARGSCRKCNWL